MTSQQWMRAAQPGHFFPQMWNDVMRQKAEPTRHINKDIKQQGLQHAPFTTLITHNNLTVKIPQNTDVYYAVQDHYCLQNKSIWYVTAISKNRQSVK